MTRGFTLIEVLVMLIIMGALTAGVAPQYRQIVEKNEMKGFANDLYSFFAQSRSEAVFRNRDLYCFFKRSGNRNDEWTLSLHLEDLATSDTISQLSGKSYKRLFVNSNFTNDRFKVGGVTGKVQQNGNFEFGLSENDLKGLKLVAHSVTGRIRLCGVSQNGYGYDKC
ncbi:prepilin-type N-terminal cleavage/methylation domain-containing protein [Vibrio tapetis subsp. quintayensis]|uniref:GspH/FimT family pseudopilin n=1 Tax=Vibrio tapetis TaxID=52443 RepID=UPI0025B2EF05|nr:GspH/FimT family pseudopilin [Vibrio tapetis]MDN3680067.1 prepilin-type N-terminal cleavage/methylation domain-containing protein [Vibrio tapetis subsp. quintayensis]